MKNVLEQWQISMPLLREASYLGAQKTGERLQLRFIDMSPQYRMSGIGGTYHNHAKIKTEIRQNVNSNIIGFWCEVLGITMVYWQRTNPQSDDKNCCDILAKSMRYEV